ncbi:MAG: hypothetical protein R3C11_02030 [Planctomycetaceae bacterium]
MLGIPEVVPCPAEEVQPLVNFLEQNQAPDERIVFPRGTVLPDGRLDLCKQNLGPDSCRLITNSLIGNEYIQSLLLGTDGIGDQGAADVAQLIRQNTNLRVIYLGCNKITSVGVKEIARAIQETDHISSLWLKRNPLGEEGYQILAEMLKSNTSLTILDLVNTNPGELGLKALVASLKQNKSITRLYLGGNYLQHQDATPLADLLASNNHLKALLLNVNRLGDDGVKELARGLSRNSTLKELGLASNGINADGCKVLIEAVQQSPALVELDLGSAPSTRTLGSQLNQIGSTGVQAIAALLQGNKMLRRLSLTISKGDSKSIQILEEALEENHTLVDLRIGQKLTMRMKTRLEENRSRNPYEFKKDSDVQLIQSVYRTKVLI